MSYEEARKAAQENLRDALNVAPGTDLNIEYYDCIDNIIEAAVEKCKEELGKQTTTTAVEKCIEKDGEQYSSSRWNMARKIRFKSMPEVRAKGWDDAVQAAVSLIDELLSDGETRYTHDEIKRLREFVRELGGQS